MSLKFALILALTICKICFGTPHNLNDYVAGGITAKNGKHPYAVIIKFGQEIQCGGSILTHRTIISAAHCGLDWYFKNLKVIVGTTRQNLNGVIYNVASVLLHPKFNEYKQLDNDISLFYVDRDIEFNKNVQPIRLGYFEVGRGLSMTFAGWGRESMLNDSTHEYLQSIEVKSLSMEYCKVFNKRVNEGQICTFKGLGYGTCIGDSGGPLVYKGYLVGIASYVMYYCGSGYPDIFTRISHYLRWIETNKI